MRRWLPLALAALLLSPEAATFPQAGNRTPGGVLLVEISAVEGAIQVIQAWFPGPVSAPVAFPLLLPEEGPSPAIRPAGGEGSEGIQVRARGGARGEFRDGGLWLAGQPNGQEEFGLEVSFRIPVTSSRQMLRAAVTAPLSQVQVAHPGGPHALHVRPLRPYAFREEDEGDGAWRYQQVPGPLAPGEVLRIAVGRLPEARRPYRWAGGALLVSVGLAALFWAMRRRD